MRSWSAPAWHAAALLAVAAVLLGTGLGRPDADRFRVAESANPACAPDAALAKVLPGSDLVLTGTASAVTPDHVDITPDRYYFGAPSWAPLKVRVDRAGWGFAWSQGQRYLVVALHGQLQECDATQVWNPTVAKVLTQQYH